MGNIKKRLVRLESKIGKSIYFVCIHPGETQEQAKERYFAKFPERRSARLIFFVIKGAGVGSSDRPEMGTRSNVSESPCTGKT